ncbi:DUF945 family protein [Halomonas sp. WWR20]
MRKAVWITGVVVAGIVAGGYLVGQAWSSRVFEHELERQVSEWDRSAQWHVSRDEVERGWFESTGRLLLEPVDPQGRRSLRLTLPYQAEHGVLTTRLAGEVQLWVGEAPTRQKLFGDILTSEAHPHWQGVYQTLNASLDAALEVPAYDYRDASSHISFGGAHVTLAGQTGSATLQAVIAPWQAGHDAAFVESREIRWQGRFQGNARGFEQRNDIELERITVTSLERPTLVFDNLLYRDKTRLGETLRYQLDLALGGLSVAGETLLSGYLDAGLENIAADAARRFVTQSAREWQNVVAWAGPSADAAEHAMWERLEPSLLAMVENSPRLVLHNLQLESAMFGVEMRGNGELTLDARDLRTAEPGDMPDEKDLHHLARRLNGKFTWYNAPPLLAMQLGLPLDTRTLTMIVTHGRITVNGRPLDMPL